MPIRAGRFAPNAEEAPMIGPDIIPGRVSVVVTLLLRYRRWEGWLLGSLNSIGWIALGMSSSMYGLVIQHCVLLYLAIRVLIVDWGSLALVLFQKGLITNCTEV
jgi:hypothetical protein